MVWLLTGSRVQAQPLPQPSVAAVHVQCQINTMSRGLWYDEFGRIDTPTLPHHSSWFYTKALGLNGNNTTLQLFVDRDETCPELEFPVTTPFPPQLACLDFDEVNSELWGGAYNTSGRVWKYAVATGWADWFDGTDLYENTFVHEPEPDQWDGLAFMPDGSLYLGADGGFNVFHLDATLQNEPVKFSDSFIVTLPSGFRPSFVTAGDVDGNGLPDILEVGGGQSVEQSHLRVIFSNCGGM